MVAEDVVFGNQLHTGMRFSVVEQQTVAVHTVAALPPDQAADLPKLSCLNFNEHLTSFPVTLNKSENSLGNIITLLRAFRRSEVALFATKATTCYAGGKGKALARKEVTK